jgi:Proteasome subunit
VVLVKEVASIMQEYTQRGGVRPFGVSLLVGGTDRTGHHLYQVILRNILIIRSILAVLFLLGKQVQLVEIWSTQRHFSKRGLMLENKLISDTNLQWN